jgi:hypothetical protein
MENQVDLSDIAFDSDAAEEIGLDADQLPFEPGSWYECDNMAHVNGVSRDAGTIQILDENNDTVFEKPLEACDGASDSPQWSCQDEVWIGSRKKDEIVFIGSSNEKGTFFEGEIELHAPFEIEKLELYYDEVDGEEIVNGVYYDGEEIDNIGGSTDGKSSDFNMVRLTDDDGNFERYDPEEKDWGTPECGSSPDDWEKSPEFKFKKIKPVHVGWYNCVWSSWGTTYGCAYWDGEQFVEFEYGKSKPITGVETWQGYNWDTADWTNRPPEPPTLVCDNKKCGWVGQDDDRARDAARAVPRLGRAAVLCVDRPERQRDPEEVAERDRAAARARRGRGRSRGPDRARRRGRGGDRDRRVWARREIGRAHV